MTDGVRWGNDSLALEVRWSAERAPWLSEIHSRDVCLRPAPGVPLLELLTVRHGHTLASGRLAHTVIGRSARYVSHEVHERNGGTTLELTVRDGASGAQLLLTLEAIDGVSAMRSRVTVTNRGSDVLALRSVPSWSAHLGLPVGQDDALRLYHARSDWLGEGRWCVEELGDQVFPRLHQELTGHDPRGGLVATSSGTWSTGSRLPMGVLASERAGIAVGWQIECNGPWRWEIGEDSDDRYLALSGPTEADHQWLKTLGPGDQFDSVPALVAFGRDFTSVVGELTEVRRVIRRPRVDRRPAIVFNDYLNTLNGDPSEEKLLPLVDAAALVGAEVFCIDAGWYDDDGDWWDSVGEWIPSQRRFPHGLGHVLDRIRSRGMTPGLWLEPEVVGVRSRIADELPREAFFLRSGQRLVEQDRYHLDLRHPAARAHLDGVVDRLVDEFGVGYLKLDYNINPGTGSDDRADSPGDGLLGHARAYLQWIDGVLDRHSGLTLENCASGAMRADAATLSHFQLQSTSDQQDPLAYPPVAASAPAFMPVEQAANWACPQPGMTAEEAAFTLVTGLAGRFYLTGHLDAMSAAQLGLVREAVTVARMTRAVLNRARPFWPLGLPGWEDEWIALGLDVGSTAYLAVWNRGGSGSVALPLDQRPSRITTVFPHSLPEWEFSGAAERGTLLLRNPTGSMGARLFRLDAAGGV